MKKFRIVALAMTLVLMLACLVACGGAKEKITVTAEVKVVDDEGEVLIDTAVKLEHAEPTVLMAIIQACQDEEIVIETTSDGKDVKKIGGYDDVEDDDYYYFWDCKFNFKAIEGKAGDVLLSADQNNVIVYEYATVEKADLGDTTEAE